MGNVHLFVHNFVKSYFLWFWRLAEDLAQRAMLITQVLDI